MVSWNFAQCLVAWWLTDHRIYESIDVVTPRDRYFSTSDNLLNHTLTQEESSLKLDSSIYQLANPLNEPSYSERKAKVNAQPCRPHRVRTIIRTFSSTSSLVIWAWASRACCNSSQIKSVRYRDLWSNALILISDSPLVFLCISSNQLWPIVLIRKLSFHFIISGDQSYRFCFPTELASNLEHVLLRFADKRWSSRFGTLLARNDSELWPGAIIEVLLQRWWSTIWREFGGQFGRAC